MMDFNLGKTNKLSNDWFQKKYSQAFQCLVHRWYTVRSNVSLKQIEENKNLQYRQYYYSNFETMAPLISSKPSLNGQSNDGTY